MASEPHEATPLQTTEVYGPVVDRLAKVSHPTPAGGLGFDLKWNMGWMHDLLDYMSRPPDERPAHQARLTASLGYAFSERFVLPLSKEGVASFMEKRQPRFAHLGTP